MFISRVRGVREMTSKTGANSSQGAFGYIKMSPAYTLVLKTGAQILQPNDCQRVRGNSKLEFLGHKLPHRNLYLLVHQRVYGGYGEINAEFGGDCQGFVALGRVE